MFAMMRTSNDGLGCKYGFKINKHFRRSTILQKNDYALLLSLSPSLFDIQFRMFGLQVWKFDLLCSASLPGLIFGYKVEN